MVSLDHITAHVQDELKSFNVFFKSSFKSNVPLLNMVTKYTLKKKGKQMRPILVFLTAKLTGEITKSTNIAASLIEMLHTATLIHDDVVDESYERRGSFSVNALWKSKAAVLLGDYLLAKGLMLSIDSNEFELLRIVSNAVKEMSEGELLQIQKSRKLNITEDEYLTIIRKKTAVLISSCTACGAKSVNASSDVIEQMKKFGENIGMAFQIKDDLFDYQLNGSIGKPTGNDIKEKKFTLPLIHALENSGSSERKKIKRLINKEKGNNIQEIIDFVIKYNGLDYSIKKMNEYKKLALDCLNNFPDNEIKQSLIDFVEFVTVRRK